MPTFRSLQQRSYFRRRLRFSSRRDGAATGKVTAGKVGKRGKGRGVELREGGRDRENKRKKMRMMTHRAASNCSGSFKLVLIPKTAAKSLSSSSVEKKKTKR